MRRTIDVPMRSLADRLNKKDNQNSMTQRFMTPYGKKRAVFLKNNYTGTGRLLLAHMAKNEKMLSTRKSKSPYEMDTETV